MELPAICVKKNSQVIDNLPPLASYSFDLQSLGKLRTDLFAHPAINIRYIMRRQTDVYDAGRKPRAKSRTDAALQDESNSLPA